MMTLTLGEEQGVLARAQSGDRAAFGELVREYQKRAYAVAYGYVRNREDALELAQESFVKAYRAMDRFDTDLPFYPWLHRIIRNTCLNYLKKRNRRAESSLEQMQAAGRELVCTRRRPDSEAADGELRGHIAEAMQRVNDSHREILTLRHVEQLAYNEIAECLNIPMGTVMSRLHAARKNLRTHIDAIRKTAPAGK